MTADEPLKGRVSVCQRVEFWTAVIITLWRGALHVLNLYHAGPLWRDEAGTADFAAMPSVREIWRNLRYDNFPPLFVAVARVWTLAGLGSDFGYRVLGFLIGMGTLGVLWWCARKLGGKTPLLVLSLYAINPVAIRVCDSLRPYGLGIALILLTSALVWNFVQAPGRKSFFLATLAATLSVQCLYQNAFFIIAFSCGAWLVCLARKEWKTAWQTGLIGLIAALSLLPYCVIIKQGREWLDVARLEVRFDSIWYSLLDTLQAPGGWAVSLAWLILFAVALAVAVFGSVRQRRWEMLYCGTILVSSTVIYLSFLQGLGLAPHMWYFLILLAPAGMMTNSILCGLENWRFQIGRAGLGLILTGGCVPACYAGVCLRQSNIDLIAAKLKQGAQSGDLIIISPWCYGVSLQRYLDANRWTTLPPLAEIRIHRFDLVKKAMVTENPIGPLLDKVRATLRSGHTLWVAGDLDAPPDGNPPPVYPPYKGSLDEADTKYFYSWMYQVTYFVGRHATKGNLVELPVPGGLAVNPFENLQLRAIHGWRE